MQFELVTVSSSSSCSFSSLLRLLLPLLSSSEGDLKAFFTAFNQELIPLFFPIGIRIFFLIYFALFLWIEKFAEGDVYSRIQREGKSEYVSKYN